MDFDSIDIEEVVDTSIESINMTDMVSEDDLLQTAHEIKKGIVNSNGSKVITFFTTDNSLEKDDVLTQITILMAKRTDKRIVVLDLNPITPTLDKFFGIDKFVAMSDSYNQGYNTGLKLVYSCIDKGNFSPYMLEEIVSKHPKYSNLFILTGLYDINSFDDLELVHYDKLISIARDLFDIVIINTNPSIMTAATYSALKNADKTLIVTNANYTYARNINFVLNYLKGILKLPPKSFSIIVNNIGGMALDRDTMEKIFVNTNIVGFLPFNKYREACINKGKIFITTKHASKDIKAYNEVLENIGIVEKLSLFKRLFKGNKLKKEIVEVDG